MCTASAYMKGMKQHLTSLRGISALCATLALSTWLALPHAAQADVPDDMARLEILPGWQMENGHRMAAIRVQLAPGWHTYWRTPGETGIPPQFDWSGSDNLAAVDIHWPVPTYFSENGMWYLGYAKEVVLPVELTPEAPGDISLHGTVDMGVCNDICVPMSARLEATLPAGATGPQNDAIRSALANRPARLTKARCTAVPISDGLRLTTDVQVPALGPNEIAMVEHPDRSIWISEAQTRRSGGTLHIETDLVPAEAQPFMLDRSALTITVIGDGRAYEAQGCTGG